MEELKRILVMPSATYIELEGAGFSGFSRLESNNIGSLVMFDMQGNKAVPDAVIEFLDGKPGVHILTEDEWFAQQGSLGFNR